MPMTSGGSAARRGLRLLLAGLGAVAVLLGVVATTRSAEQIQPPSRPLHTSLYLDSEIDDPRGHIAFARTRDAGATMVRLGVQWRLTAPVRRTPSFEAANPFDPGYRWARVDRLVRLATSHGLAPILTIYNAPAWAETDRPSRRRSDGAYQPDPDELAKFARAIAERYDGTRPGLPRVRYWQVWNEPNASSYLAPQHAGRRPVSAERYRRMLNAAARAIHDVDPSNVVVAAGLSPFTVQYNGGETIGPLEFMEQLLCVTRGKRPRPTCRTLVEFDVWAHHPYTSGSPTRQATLDQDASIGDLPEMRSMLVAAHRAGQIESPKLPDIWATEFSWDSAPPDPKGLPLGLHARWISEALYLMWRSGVTNVTWFLLRDQDSSGFAQSGLYLRGRSLVSDRPKPALRSFRFPFVAYARESGVFVWARTPRGRRGTVLIQQRVKGRWVTLRRVVTNASGILTATVKQRRGGGMLRAKLTGGGAVSLAFSLKEPPDRYVCPFGTCQ